MIQLYPVGFAQEVTPESDLPGLLADALATSGLLAGDILVVTSKVVSKWLGLYVPDGTDRATAVLDQARSIVAERQGAHGVTRIVHSVAGPVMAAAGVDASNTADDRLLLLPQDPDAVARRLRTELATALDREADFAVLLSDTAGRPWRVGQTDFALGAAGLRTVDDLRGHADGVGRDLAVTIRNIADEVASAADLVKGKVDRIPAAVLRGLSGHVDDADGAAAADLVRTGPGDWFGLGRAEAVRAALGVPPGSAQSEQIGIAATAPEELVQRVRRAVRVAGHGPTSQVRITFSVYGDAGSLDLISDDPFALGRVWARLEVALAGELIQQRGERKGPTTVHLEIAA